MKKNSAFPPIIEIGEVQYREGVQEWRLEYHIVDFASKVYVPGLGHYHVHGHICASTRDIEAVRLNHFGMKVVEWNVLRVTALNYFKLSNAIRAPHEEFMEYTIILPENGEATVRTSVDGKISNLNLNKYWYLELDCCDQPVSTFTFPVDIASQPVEVLKILNNPHYVAYSYDYRLRPATPWISRRFRGT